jgi:hypothetical protein
LKQTNPLLYAQEVLNFGNLGQFLIHFGFSDDWLALLRRVPQVLANWTVVIPGFTHSLQRAP